MKLKLSLCVGICYLFVGAFSASIELKDDENYLPAKGFVCSLPSLPEFRDTQERIMWPEGKVYFEISKEFDNAHNGLIKSAIKKIEAVSCVRFHEVPKCEKGCILIQPTLEDMCATSNLGYIKNNKVNVFLGPFCMNEHTVIHELTHALGRHHEQCRADQKVYITIDKDNIKADRENNYESDVYEKSYGFPYDYDSIMHYHGIGFAKDQGKSVIVPKYWEISKIRNIKMTVFDIKKLNTMYNCTRE